KNMLKIIKAKYNHGLFEPLEKVNLRDGMEVNLVIDNYPDEMSEEDKDRLFLSSAGGWKDIVDEGFLDEICLRE
ncbi:MAG: antitoxin family protein, partial [Candidatus Poribacteria bacterium]